MLGRETTTPLHLLTPPPSEMHDKTPWVETLHENFQEAQRNTLAHYGRAQRAQKTYYDQRQRGIRFKEGDSVWLAIKRMKKRGLYKLNPQRWEGPYEIRKCLSTTVFVIARPGRQQTQVVSGARLTLVINRRKDLIPSPEILANNAVSTEPSDISEVIPGEYTGTNYNLDTQQKMRLVSDTP